MKISDCINYASAQLQKVKIDTPKLDVMIFMQNALDKPREFIITNSDELILPAEEARFWEMVQRRIKREPLAYITGKKEFYGRDFKVSPDVLTPRPDTEMLIEAALALYPKLAEIKVLDLGTGSGCIILTLLAELPNSSGIGVDISNSALAIAKDNAYNLGIANVEFVESDWANNLKEKKFNLIVSNPPYIPKPEQVTLEAELGYEPETALFGGDDGLECYRKLALEISKLEFEYAIFEIGINQEKEIKKIFDEHQIKLREMKKDLAGINRVMIFTKTPT